MSVLTEFTVPAKEFILRETLEAVPDVRIEIERVVADSQHVTPYFWVTGEQLDAFECALEADKSVEAVIQLEDHSDKQFYRVVWQQRIGTISHAVSKAKATILEATSEGREWNLKLLFPDESSLTDFHDYCTEHSLSFQLTRLYESRHPDALGKYEVTTKQREALLVALESGYFSVPRDITLEDVAVELDISPNALSTRLRRGHANLITNTLRHEG
ncbi:helix-turn-helix domain-containing protein [Haladaptatus cibarius]|uniref:helix-turn-helix domain-containing protein n=1 Tax=Haladaptatus cibarius TaxID=453847 RepID=UPI0006793DEA|nr:helix-turn-helix domain-containing protein [Haladaptatus cibarius]